MNSRIPSITPAKITRPKTRNVVARPRLVSLLARPSSMPIIWLTSLAGSGKTSLVAGYIQEQKAPCIWYQCDAGDADLPTFFYYMSLAAREVSPC